MAYGLVTAMDGHTSHSDYRVHGPYGLQWPFKLGNDSLDSKPSLSAIQ